uniref:Mitochondrial tricarboxylate transporter-like protein 3 n=1 Tax=Karlodinium veneficum TaxID=407301 RepID=F2WQ66_KARVE|nr:mitochondrial tricarboxylate transporter-like protein 3 [Karlodinium veneficum]
MAFVTKKDTGFKTVVKGFLTGGTQAAVTYPTEFVKTQLQLQSKSNPEFNGIIDCFKKTISRHGVGGVYVGAPVRIIGAGFQQMCRWGSYTNLAGIARDKETGKLSAAMTTLCGLGAGITEAVFAVTPVETLKTRVTDDQRRGTGNYKGTADALTKILKSEGPIGLYRGALPTILKQGTNQAVRMPVQVQLVSIICMGDELKKQNPAINGAGGFLAGCISVLLTQPQDCVKSRMQSEAAKELYSGTVDCALKMLRAEGAGAFFAGAVPRCVQVGMANGISFALFPIISNALNKVM